jgi:hypothetical protein
MRTQMQTCMRSDPPVPSLTVMDLADNDQRAAWKHELGGLFRGLKVATGLLPLAAFAPWVELLANAGALRPLVVATGLGAGPVPTDADAEIVLIDHAGHASMTDELRRIDHLARNLPPAANRALAAYDPDRKAAWLHGPFVVSEPIDGRRVLGGRPAAWLALEDKLIAEEVWQAVSAAHAPARVVPTESDALARASAELDSGAGAVWTADARDGFHGGGDLTRWVMTEEDRVDALAYLGPRCDRVRVMPFLDGVPCSIHGFVLPDGVAAFRPVELAILRGPGRRFVYGGQGTTWDPPAPDRGEMRELARRTGEHLRARVGYRGAFGIDGVLTSAGFRPTEINTRFTGGLSALAQVTDTEAFNLLQFSCLAGRDPGVTVAELEAWSLTRMDRQRLTKAVGMSTRRVTEETRYIPVRWDGADLRREERAEVDEGPSVMVGPASVGAFVRLADDVLARGDRLAPLNAAMFRLVDAELGTGFGEVTPAPDRRTG